MAIKYKEREGEREGGRKREGRKRGK